MLQKVDIKLCFHDTVLFFWGGGFKCLRKFYPHILTEMHAVDSAQNNESKRLRPDNSTSLKVEKLVIVIKD